MGLSILQRDYSAQIKINEFIGRKEFDDEKSDFSEVFSKWVLAREGAAARRMGAGLDSE